MTRPGIDPRGPRFAAAITAALLLVVIGLALSTPLGGTVGDRAKEPAFILLTVLGLLFAWHAFAGIARGPWALLFRKLVRPRLAPPADLEDPAPPTFAQGVGLVIAAAGLALHLIGVPHAVAVAAGLAFIAAFLNAAFGFCLGCQLYLLLARAGVVARKGAARA